MYPIRSEHLPLEEVAHHWRRFVEGAPPTEELCGLLVAGFWRGDLILRGGDGRSPVMSKGALVAFRAAVRDEEAQREAAASALGLEKTLIEPGDRPKRRVFVIWEEDELAELGPVTRGQIDGSVAIDCRTRIQLPADPVSWTEEIIAAACAILAEIRWSDLPMAFQIGVRPQQTLKSDFARFCDLNGYARPAFWFGPTETKPMPMLTARAEKRFQQWFAKQVQAPQLYGRDSYCLLAQEEFPGLSANRFNEEWDRSAPDAWKKPGRRRGLAKLPQG